ncbi:MAG: orotidine-5'-phosphate decarboxylase [Planctomycetota bacterium]|jgi:orotidine-5'-phosphate decarboxylase
MSMHVADQLQDSIDRSGSLACVGLDPRPALLPPTLRQQHLGSHADPRQAVAAAFLAFNRAILDAIAGACACVKPQVACYEAYGAPGMAALEATISHARHLGIPVVVDGKRNDIGSTATHYQQAWLGHAPGLADDEVISGAGGDWLTINGYLGSDGVLPFLDNQAGTGGVFVLVKTSNPGSAELQGLPCGDATVMEAMADLVRGWGDGRNGSCGLNDVGAVVGATWPDEARRLRDRMPDTLFLVPGYGAQGGSAADALAGLRSDGRGVIVNSSRGIIAAWQSHDSDDWADCARAALDAMNADLASAR